MRTVFNNDMVAHVWAQRNQENGRTSNHNYSFQGPILFSYRTPIALFCKGTRDRDIALISSERYSVSTARHISLARRALHGVKVFEVPHLNNRDSVTWAGSRNLSELSPKDARPTHKLNLVYLVNEYLDVVTKCKRAVNLYYADEQALAERFADSANVAKLYAEAFNLPAPKLNPLADASHVWAYRVERERRTSTPEHQAKLERARERREEKKEEAREAERIRRYDNCLNRFLRYMTEEQCSYVGYIHAYEFPTDSIERRYLESAERARNVEEGRIARVAFDAWQAGLAKRPDSLNRYATYTDVERKAFDDAVTAERVAELQTHIDAWRNGDDAQRYRLSSLSPMLRLRQRPADVEGMEYVVITSYGAEFPLAHALRAIPVVLRCVETSTGWTPNGHSVNLGHFSVKEIRPNGDVIAGCHHVRFEEIRRFIDVELTPRGLYPVANASEVATDENV